MTPSERDTKRAVALWRSLTRTVPVTYRPDHVVSVDGLASALAAAREEERVRYGGLLDKIEQDIAEFCTCNNVAAIVRSQFAMLRCDLVRNALAVDPRGKETT